ncbi:hypothetical protein PInf_004387 [Phytophthora infestans]|nr:hypothetical protein PInf_004387 [Phytophthora infestans]
MSTVSSPKVSEFERPPIMEHFKQSKSTRKLNTQPSMPMLGAGGRQLSQDTVQWEPTPDPTTNYMHFSGIMCTCMDTFHTCGAALITYR